jgi:hypothetical protein
LIKKGKGNRKLNHSVTFEIDRLQKRLAEVTQIDFFSAPARETVDRLLFGLHTRLNNHAATARAPVDQRAMANLQGRTWITRKGIHVDRMASAWLIRRFIDQNAKFKFVAAKGYKPEMGELRFDMYEAEFTHEGDRCTFEVLLDRAGLREPGLRAISEIVHAVDLKDSKFVREESTGIDRLISGIAMAHKEDDQRLERAAAMFDDLYAYFQRKGESP